jgi:prepilin-type N-terminal cleavage/methylation domain-containing protein
MLARLQRNNRGDTIIEVMIVLAVLGLAIGISYATANRSLLNARQAQENSQATALAQSQVEALRTLAASGTPNIFQSGPYCISQTTPYSVQTGAACNRGTIPYNIAVTYDNNPTDTFTVKIGWPDVIGTGDDTVTIVYRLHKP